MDWAPNFDDRLEEPKVLPGRFPNFLLNGSAGIAVGMSTNVPPHNLREVGEAVRILVNDPECTVGDLMRVLPGPDFPTGGFLVGLDGIRDMYETGRGRLVMRARVVKEALRGGKQQLVVTELPYGVSKAKIIEQIADLSRKGKIDEVSELQGRVGPGRHASGGGAQAGLQRQGNAPDSPEKDLPAGHLRGPSPGPGPRPAPGVQPQGDPGALPGSSPGSHPASVLGTSWKRPRRNVTSSRGWWRPWTGSMKSSPSSGNPRTGPPPPSASRTSWG